MSPAELDGMVNDLPRPCMHTQRLDVSARVEVGNITLGNVEAHLWWILRISVNASPASRCRRLSPPARRISTQDSEQGLASADDGGHNDQRFLNTRACAWSSRRRSSVMWTHDSVAPEMFLMSASTFMRRAVDLPRTAWPPGIFHLVAISRAEGEHFSFLSWCRCA